MKPKPRARPNSPEFQTNVPTMDVQWQFTQDSDINKESWQWETGDVERKRQELLESNAVPQTCEEWYLKYGKLENAPRKLRELPPPVDELDGHFRKLTSTTRSILTYVVIVSLQIMVVTLPTWVLCPFFRQTTPQLYANWEMEWGCSQIHGGVYYAAVVYFFGSLQGFGLWYCCGGEQLGDNYHFFKYETCYWSLIFGNDEERAEEIRAQKQRDAFSENAISSATGIKSTFIQNDSQYRTQMLSRRKEREETRRLKAFAPVPSKRIITHYVPFLVVSVWFLLTFTLPFFHKYFGQGGIFRR